MPSDMELNKLSEHTLVYKIDFFLLWQELKQEQNFCGTDKCEKHNRLLTLSVCIGDIYQATKG